MSLSIIPLQTDRYTNEHDKYVKDSNTAIWACWGMKMLLYSYTNIVTYLKTSLDRFIWHILSCKIFSIVFNYSLINALMLRWIICPLNVLPVSSGIGLILCSLFEASTKRLIKHATISIFHWKYLLCNYKMK